MINSTLCYITRGDQVLMLHRVKKQNDINKARVNVVIALAKALGCDVADLLE